jgi:hypothetical protein
LCVGKVLFFLERLKFQVQGLRIKGGLSSAVQISKAQLRATIFSKVYGPSTMEYRLKIPFVRGFFYLAPISLTAYQERAEKCGTNL